MVNLTTLAPEIVAAILDDELPNHHMTLLELVVDPPALWDGQQKRLEMARRPPKPVRSRGFRQR